MKRIVTPAALALCSSLVSVYANTFPVISTADAGPGTLRQAIIDANAMPGPDVINFQFAAYPVTIVPLSPLPDILDQVVIDATDPNFCLDGTKPRVQIDGKAAGGLNVPGLAVHTPAPVVIKGLAIYNFSGPGILVEGNTGSKITGNYLGTDATGALPGVGNSSGIVLRNSGSVVVGGVQPCERNVLSGNRNGGVDIDAGAQHRVINNLIGTAASGTFALPNRYGVAVNAGSQHLIGTTNLGEGNVISGNTTSGVMLTGPLGVPSDNHVEANFIGTRFGGAIPLPNLGDGVYFIGGPTHNFIRYNIIKFNVGDGVLVLEGTDNTIVENFISDNGRLGIDLTPAYAVNPNDIKDPDAGPNRQQNYPGFYIIYPPITDASGTTFQIDFNSEPLTKFELHFYWSPACDPSGYGEGKHFFAKTNVTTDASGNIGLMLMSFSESVPIGSVLTATATHPNGSTSEFSPCSPKVVAAGGVVTHSGLPHQPFGNTTLTPQPDGTLEVRVAPSTAATGAATGGVQIALGQAQGWAGKFRDLHVKVGGSMEMEAANGSSNPPAIWTRLSLVAAQKPEVKVRFGQAGSAMLRAVLLNRDGSVADTLLLPNGGTYTPPTCSATQDLHLTAGGFLRLANGMMGALWQVDDDDWCGTKPPPHPPVGWPRLVSLPAALTTLVAQTLVIFPEIPAPATPGQLVPAGTPCIPCLQVLYVTTIKVKPDPDPCLSCPFDFLRIDPIEVLQNFGSLHEVVGGGQTLFSSQKPGPHPWLDGSVFVQSANAAGNLSLALPLDPRQVGLPALPIYPGKPQANVTPDLSDPPFVRYIGLDIVSTMSAQAADHLLRYAVAGPVRPPPGTPVEDDLVLHLTERGWQATAHFGASGATGVVVKTYYHGQQVGAAMPVEALPQLRLPGVPNRVAFSTSVSANGTAGWALYWGSDPMPAVGGPQPLPWDELRIDTFGSSSQPAGQANLATSPYPHPWIAQLTIQASGFDSLEIIGEETRPAMPGPLSVTTGSQGILLSYPTEQGRPYRLEYTESFSAPIQWNVRELFLGDGSVHRVTDPRQGQSRFYRLAAF